MFNGNYNFFDYKYNIEGYTGQHFGSIYQYIYLGISIVLLVVLLILLRKSSKEKVLKIIRAVSIFMIIFYIGKTTWESIYDIQKFGEFNYNLLPFDTCSIIMYAGILSGFGKGKIKDMATCWLATGCIVGGIANMLFLNAFKFYPFFSFGAFYSMIWHFLMVFIGLLIIVTNYVDMKYDMVLKGYKLHLLISLIVILMDFIFDFDFMLYKNLGGVPIFQNVAEKLTSMNLQILNPIMMLILYFVFFNIIYFIAFGIKKIIRKKTLN